MWSQTHQRQARPRGMHPRCRMLLLKISNDEIASTHSCFQFRLVHERWVGEFCYGTRRHICWRCPRPDPPIKERATNTIMHPCCLFGFFARIDNPFSIRNDGTDNKVDGTLMVGRRCAKIKRPQRNEVRNGDWDPVCKVGGWGMFVDAPPSPVWGKHLTAWRQASCIWPEWRASP